MKALKILVGLSFVTAVGCGDGSISANNLANGRDALDTTGGTVSSCESLDVAACMAREDCILRSVPEMWSEECDSDNPPDFCDPDAPVCQVKPVDDGVTDNDCSTVSSDGTITYQPCEPGDGSGSAPPSSGNSSGSTPPSSGGSGVVSDPTVSSCESLDVAACMAREDCILRSVPEMWSEECDSDNPPDFCDPDAPVCQAKPVDDGVTDNDCSTVSSDGTITYQPCEPGDGSGSAPPSSGDGGMVPNAE